MLVLADNTVPTNDVHTTTFLILSFVFIPQDKYLNDTIIVLAKVLEAGDILRLIRETIISEDFTKLFNETMATILNSVSSESVYKKTFEVFEKRQRSSYISVSLIKLILVLDLIWWVQLNKKRERGWVLCYFFPIICSTHILWYNIIIRHWNSSIWILPLHIIFIIFGK